MNSTPDDEAMPEPARSERRLAAIDLGTNSVLLSVVETSGPTKTLSSVHEEARVTRLGEGVDESGSLSEAAMARTLDCLRDFVTRARALGAESIVVGGTSALRDAKNGQFFRQKLQNELQVPVEIVTGKREAHLTFSGAVSGLDVTGRLFVFDIGGGSTEFILGEQHPSGSQIHFSKSLNVGSVRMFERARPSDPMTETERLSLEAVFEEALSELGPAPRADSYDAAVGVAGTVTSLAALAMGLSSYERPLVHGATIQTSALRSTLNELARLTVLERRNLTALEAGRADVIVVGGLWLLSILRWLGKSEVVASDRGVRFGLLREMTTER